MALALQDRGARGCLQETICNGLGKSCAPIARALGGSVAETGIGSNWQVRPPRASGAQGRSFSWRAHGDRTRYIAPETPAALPLACLHPLGAAACCSLPGCMAASTAGHCSGLAHGPIAWHVHESANAAICSTTLLPRFIASYRHLPLVGARCCDLMRSVADYRGADAARTQHQPCARPSLCCCKAMLSTTGPA